MAANANVVDELIVKITLDSKEYKKADKEIDRLATGSERKAKTRDKDMQKRMKESAAAAKTFGNALKSLAVNVGAVLGVTGAAGLVGAVVALTNFETNLRRTAVSTGLSNREMQAWGSAARRLGADAQAGAQAIADLAREQKQAQFGAPAPTIAALSRLGVRVGPNSNLADILSQAQTVYRNAAPGQRGQIEAGLAASGVSNDLIVLIKSEKDVRAEFAKSFAESAEENRNAMDAVASVLESLKNNLLNIANVVATALQPNLESLATWSANAAAKISDFVSKVIAAGGGVDGFTKVLDDESPGLSATLKALSKALSFFGEVIDVVVYGFQSLYKGLAQFFNWTAEISDKLTGGVTKALRSEIAEAFSSNISRIWGQTLNEARREGAAPVGALTGSAGGVRLTPGAQARIAAGELGGGGGKGAQTRPSAQDVMGYLISQGLTVQQAAAVAANIQGESNFDPGAFNSAGGGQGAHGLAQWRGARLNAFKAANQGMYPSEATWQQQLDFLLNNPYERSKLNQSFAAGGNAQQLGTSFSRIFEAHGKDAIDRQRGVQAQLYAQQYNTATGPGAMGGAAININGPVTVQANNPTEFIGSIQRVTNTGNYASGVR